MGSLESHLIDAVGVAIDSGVSPEQVIAKLGELWEIEMRERADEVRKQFERITPAGANRH